MMYDFMLQNLESVGGKYIKHNNTKVSNNIISDLDEYFDDAEPNLDEFLEIKHGGDYSGIETELTASNVCMSTDGGICSMGNIKMAIAEFAKTASNVSQNDIKIVEDTAKLELSDTKTTKDEKAEEKVLIAAMNKARVKNELELLNSVQFKKTGISNEEIQNELEAHFKAYGPRHSTAWLSNLNIDETLLKWAIEFDDFYYCPFAMIDFEKTNILLNRITMSGVYNGIHSLYLGEKFGYVDRYHKYFACVINTDVSTGPGQHWMAIFVDMSLKKTKNATIEFFNSTGERAQASIQRWQAKQKKDIEENLKMSATILDATNGTEHQKSNTECGVYSLYYIRSRLEGKPIEYFSADRIPDKHMILFRQYLFIDDPVRHH